MKKVLFILLAGFLSFGSAQAIDLSVGVGANQAVFAATGKEFSCNESGSGCSSLDEYGAFEESYPSVFVEAGNEVLSVGISYHGGFNTPTNVVDRGPNDSKDRTSVSASFDQYFQGYVKVNIPLGGLYMKAGMSQVEIKTNETTVSGNSYPDTDTTGHMVGIGYEIENEKGVNVRLEIQGHAFDDVTVNNGKATSANFNEITISDMIGATGSFQLVKTF